LHQQKILQGLASEASKPQRAAVFMLQDQLSKEWYGAIRCSKYVAACGQETAVRLGIEMATEAFCTTLLKNMRYMYTANLLQCCMLLKGWHKWSAFAEIAPLILRWCHSSMYVDCAKL